MTDRKMLEATYMVDHEAVLHLKEQQDGFRYYCIETDEQHHRYDGMIDILDVMESPIRSPLAAARVLAIQEIGLSGNVVQAVDSAMLAQLPYGRRILKECGHEDSENKSIRFIDSHYKDLFRIPDGGVILVEYPDRQFLAKCAYLDQYHLEVSGECYHICQFAEILERGGATCAPERITDDRDAAFHVNRKGYLMLQECEDGWDYTVTDERFHELDGGQLDNPELSLQEARNEILSDLGWDKRSMVKLGYEFVRDKADAVAEKESKEVRKSALEQLAGTASISGGGATKHKEAVR